MVDDLPSADSTEKNVAPDRGTFVPLIFGGACAVALGFFAGQTDQVEQWLGIADDGTAVEQTLQEQAQRIDAQARELSAQSDVIAALTDRLENLPPPADLSGLEKSLADQSNAAAELALRIAEVEKRPMTQGVSEDAIAAYQSELDRLQDAVAAQRGEMEDLLAEAKASETSAEEKARLSLARAAMTRIIAAVDSGAPFAEAAADLQAVGGIDLPAALKAAADTGVPTLADVQRGYPDVARAALSAARAEEAASGEGGIGAFIQRRLGARSVTPQEGSSPDAVLSRAEAAVREGRLGDALAELELLPNVARTAMSDWNSIASARHSASLAADELITALSAN